MELPAELKEAMQILGEAEKANTPDKTISKFDQGIEILETYLEENPNNKYIEKIINIITSYTRVMVAKTILYVRTGNFEDDFNLWIDYLLGFAKAGRYIGDKFIYNQELNRCLIEFLEIHVVGDTNKLKRFIRNFVEASYLPYEVKK